MTANADRLRAGLQSWAQQVQMRTGRDMPDEIRRTGLVPRDEGELAASIRNNAGVTSTGSGFSTRIEAPVIQAATTDKGARPHRIVPRRAGGVLVFNWPKAGGTVYLRHVNHPGNPPRPWWRRAVEQAYGTALRRAARSVPFR